MPLTKLNLEVDQPGYGGDFGQPVHSAQLDGGPSWTRRKFLGTVFNMTAQFTLDPLQYSYWQAFYRGVIAEGSSPFLLDLIVQQGELEEYEVKIVPGTMRLLGIAGDARVIAMELEVVPNAQDADLDASNLLLYQLYGDEGPAILARLRKLVNVDAYEAFGDLV
jgi:hypothetical protein